MTGIFSKQLKPGERPRPDWQGNADTCTSHGVGKALTGGLHYGKFGTTLDVSQPGVVNALIQKRQNIDACWPDELDKESILLLDRTSSDYYKIGLNVVACDYQHLLKNWDRATFVVVYRTIMGLHTVYVNKVHDDGNLCCFNSHGTKDQFPRLKPTDVIASYEVTANVTKVSKNNQLSPTTQRKSSHSSGQATLTKQITVAEKKTNIDQEKKKAVEENVEMMAKMAKENELLEKNDKFVRFGWFKKGAKQLKKGVKQLADKFIQ